MPQSSTRTVRLKVRAESYSGWGMLRRFLQYKGEYAGRSVQVVNERNTTRGCSGCGALVGPTGPDSLVVRHWRCVCCGEVHDRDVNAARNILRVGLRSQASVRGNESLPYMLPPSHIYGVREAGPEAWRVAA